MLNPRFMTLTSMILMAVLSRLLPHPWNFSPLAGIALFSGAHFSRKVGAFAVPLAALFISDLLIGFYKEMWVVYGCFALIVLIGLKLKQRKRFWPVAAAALGSSVLFFVATNFVMWLSYYPPTTAGFVACYTAAIPFFQNTLLGDVFYTGVLFGLMRLAEKRFSILREHPLVA